MSDQIKIVVEAAIVILLFLFNNGKITKNLTNVASGLKDTLDYKESSLDKDDMN